MNDPSGLHETVLLKTFARKLAGWPVPPSTEAMWRFLNWFSPTGRYASHLLSGDQTNGRSEINGGRSKKAVATTRSVFVVISITRNSLPPLINASDLPSGEKRGVESSAPSRVSCVSALLVKS